MATKTTAPAADAFAMPAFDPAKITDNFREYADKGMAQSKEAYAKMKTATEDATKTVEKTVETAQAGSVALGMKSIEAFRTSTENSFAHLEALLGVKSVAEVIELQTAFVRKQAELSVDQAKAMQEASKKVVEDVVKPGKTAMDKALKDMKIA